MLKHKKKKFTSKYNNTTKQTFSNFSSAVPSAEIKTIS